jgi:hypothetical protein
MELINHIKEIKMALFNPFDSTNSGSSGGSKKSLGRFLGEIVDNEDPEKIQRVKVKIKGLNDNIPKDDLPWLTMSHGPGTFKIPPNGTIVEVEFPEDDIYSGYITGTRPSKSNTINDPDGLGEKIQDSPPPGDTAEAGVNVTPAKDFSPSQETNYPNSYGSVDETGNWYRVDKSAGSVEFVHSSGSFFKIDGGGNVSIKITGSLKIDVVSDTLATLAGSILTMINGSDTLKISGGYKVTSSSGSEFGGGGFFKIKDPTTVDNKLEVSKDIKDELGDLTRFKTTDGAKRAGS